MPIGMWLSPPDRPEPNPYQDLRENAYEFIGDPRLLRLPDTGTNPLTSYIHAFKWA
jgi:hypothetical protein